MKRRLSTQTTFIPVPVSLLHRRKHHGEFQCGPAVVTLRQYRGAIEAFSNGSMTVLTRTESLKSRGKETR
jgi:hypothetical protein